LGSAYPMATTSNTTTTRIPTIPSTQRMRNSL
jgi:hypothetical protein